MTTEITIKNLKYSDFASQETHCFEGTVYVNGKRFCLASNDGHGGCDNYWPVPGFKGNLHEEIKKLDQLIADERADEYEDGIGPDFEWAVCDAVNAALSLKDMKRAMRRHWIYEKKPGDGLWQTKRLKNHTVEHAAAEVSRLFPGARLLQALPEAEALKLWRAQ